MKISVIIPIYNAEKTIERCVKSILKQTVDDYEVILVNDGSKDNSLNLCEHFAQYDNRIRVISQLNSGPSKTRNVGIDNSLGDYLCFVDADDWLEEDYLSVFLENLKDDRTLLIQDIFRDTIDSNQRVVESRHNSNYIQGMVDVIDANRLIIDYNLLRFGYPFGKFYKASIVKEKDIRFNPGIHFSEDLIFLLEYLKYQDGVFFISKPSYHYIVSGFSLSNAYHSFDSEIMCYEKMRNLASELFFKKDVYINSLTRSKINGGIGHFLTRAIESMYRPKTYKEKRERLKRIAASWTDENQCYFSERNNGGLKKINAYLFRNRMFQVFDFCLKLQFAIRYGLGDIWIKYRKNFGKLLRG
ncbi:glycosyltransferase family 2 protein [Sphingobacterium thalpophilum]|uniref:glycosyltransferase family 2 protein n=1 Tax=Sphingobacterium thalpophilum TaxID=259 RepID=UPI003D999E72